MEYEAAKIGNVEGLGDIYQVEAPLHEQLKSFAGKGVNTLVAPDEVAEIRLVGLSNDYSRTSIAPVAVKGARTILVRNSPLMNPLMAVAAVKAHANGRYFEINKEFYEGAEALANSQDTLVPEDRDAIFLSQEKDYDLTPEMPESHFLLRKHTLPYFTKFTKGIIHLSNLFGDSKDLATVNYLWFGVPQIDSGFSCRYRSLDDHDRAFGVFLKTGKASPKNSSYSLTEIKNANSENVHKVLGGTPSLEKTLGDILTKGLIDKLRRQ